MLRIVSFPGRDCENPYIALFYDALKPYGIDLVDSPAFDLGWFEENHKSFDAVHFHWPEMYWRNYTPPFLKKLQRSKLPGRWKLSSFYEFIFDSHIKRLKSDWFETIISFLKHQNKRIIYTWHNVTPHENSDDLDYRCNEILAKHSNLIIFHSSLSEVLCQNNHQIKAKTIIMPHGNYDGIYPPPRKREFVANELGLSLAKPIIGILGFIRDYKGIDIACKAIQHLEGQVQFLCAGKPHLNFDMSELSKQFDLLKGAVLIQRELTDQEFSDYTNLCDLMALPYKKVTGSGALLAFLTLGKSVVASDLPYFREVLDKQKDSGILVRANDPSALVDGIKKCLEIPLELRSLAAKRLSEEYKWSDVVMPVATFLTRGDFTN